MVLEAEGEAKGTRQARGTQVRRGQRRRSNGKSQWEESMEATVRSTVRERQVRAGSRTWNLKNLRKNLRSSASVLYCTEQTRLRTWRLGQPLSGAHRGQASIREGKGAVHTGTPRQEVGAHMCTPSSFTSCETTESTLSPGFSAEVLFASASLSSTR